ncbi:MAG TPA: polysaccharide deacetylase family protein [Conexibacter sp.]|nr:polysaccharide deacetylase family protein [Conexibacter sp.]
MSGALVACAVAVVAAIGCAGCGAGSHSQGATTQQPAASTSQPAAATAPSATRRAAEARVAAALARLAARGRPVYCGGRTRPWVAFTFDDGPGVYTRLAVRILSAAHVPATFFLVGQNLAPFDSARRVEQRIGALGDHTWTHPDLAMLGAGAVEQQIASTKQAIERVSGRRVQLFRPPYGVRDATVDATARRLGLVDVLWTVDSADSLGANYAQIARNVLAGLHPGSIILMHENRGQTIRALKFHILPRLRGSHLRLVTLPQLLSQDPPSPRQLALGRLGCGGGPTRRSGA